MNKGDGFTRLWIEEGGHALFEPEMWMIEVMRKDPNHRDGLIELADRLGKHTAMVEIGSYA